MEYTELIHLYMETERDADALIEVGMDIDRVYGH